MSNKIRLSLIVAIGITSLSAAFLNPLGNKFKAIDNGGLLAAIDAYQDGIGAVIVSNLSTVDNSAMNTLVYTYGEEAKANNTTIVDQVAYGTVNTPEADLKLLSALTVDGVACNDQNVNTTGETWLNNVCQGGIYINGTHCNDGNAQTINDIYTNNICEGINVEGQGCTDGNFLTIQDKYVNGVCIGTLTANGQTCNDNNVMTVNDIYTNGVCAGTLTVNGTTCTHSDPKVINETWLNGVCEGTLTVNGQTCNDNNTVTINDIYTNGVCLGKITATPTCSDTLMTWNSTSKLCSKGSISTYTGTSNNSYTCPSGGTLSGTTCLKSSTYAGTYNSAYTCPSGGTLSGTTCLKSSSYAGSYYNSYTCPNGGTLSGTTCLKSSTYTATATLVGNNTWTFCAYDQQYCSFSGTRRVNYHNGGTIFGTVTASNVKYCYPTEFGIYYDPAVGILKQCSYENQSTIYTCPSGGTLSGSTCTINQNYTATNSPYYTCPSGGTLSGSTCIINQNYTATNSSYYSCPSGGTLSGSTCTLNQNYTATNSPYYTCPNGGTLSGSTCTINTILTAAGICNTGYTYQSTGMCLEN